MGTKSSISIAAGDARLELRHRLYSGGDDDHAMSIEYSRKVTPEDFVRFHGYPPNHRVNHYPELNHDPQIVKEILERFPNMPKPFSLSLVISSQLPIVSKVDLTRLAIAKNELPTCFRLGEASLPVVLIGMSCNEPLGQGQFADDGM